MDQSMYRHIKELAPVAYAHLKIIESERGTPADLLFLDVNKAFEELAGLREQQVVGRKATEVFPGIGKSSFDWIGTCGEVALQGTDKAFEAYCASLGRHLRVTAYAPEAGEVAGFFIATTGTDGEDTLPKEEERRRRHAANILAATGAGIWEWNVQTGEVVFGERSAEILGHSLQEIHPFTISDWFERTHPTDLPACREMIDQHLSGRRERFECEHRVLHRKGHWLWVANRGKVIAWNPQGRPLWVYGTLLDIAERKSARQEAEEQRKRLTNILEGTGAATWEWNVRTGELLVNRRWAEMLGYRLEELQPGSIDTWKELTHPEDLHHSMAQLERHFRGETPRYESELRMRHRDGRWIWMVDRGKVISRTEAGEPLWVYGTHLDITARKEAREEIARQRERLANIIEGTEAGTWEWNVRTGETIFNERTARILGYRLADLEPTTIQTWVEIAHPEDFQRCQSLFREHLKGPKPFFECEHRVWHGDGRWIWIQDRGKVVSRTETGEPLWVSGIILDVTARKEAEEKLRISEERATAANRAKSSFLATVSHEIRTPMNGVLAMTGLLFDTPLTPKQRHYAEIVRSSGEALLHLINDILDYSRIEAGKLSLECEDFDLQDMLDDFADSIALQAHHKGLEFVCTLNPDVPTLLWGDPGRLRQVLTNLAGNAIKFTEQGEVTITCSSLCTTEREVLLRFSVRDTGIGIPEKDRERLFEEFARLEGEAKQNEGTGLGLAISRRLVELMGGEIGVESTPGEGSTFRFTARLARQSRDAGAPVPLTALGDIPILIADRNDLRRESPRNTTPAWGMRSTTAANGV
ncbi:MAG: PAS domain-containing protein, partial [Synergistales bacterium]|nr:PAS domain-containing protein [Synergistales bacterium]